MKTEAGVHTTQKTVYMFVAIYFTTNTCTFLGENFTILENRLYYFHSSVKHIIKCVPKVNINAC